MKKPNPGPGDTWYGIKRFPKNMVAEKRAARKMETGLTKQSPSSPRSVKGGVEAPSGYGKQNRDSSGAPKPMPRKDSVGVPKPMPRKTQPMDPKKALKPLNRY